MKFIKSFFKDVPLYVKYLFLAAIILGLLIRVLNLFNLGYHFDMVETQYTWGKNAWGMGIFDFWKNYPMSKLFDYPFLSLVYEYIVYGIAQIFGGSEFVFVTILKIVNAFFDMAIFAAIFYFVKEFVLNNIEDTKKKINIKSFVIIGSSLLFIFPTTWFISGLWGQNDTLIVFLTLISIMLLYKNKPLTSGLVLSICIFIKPQPLIIIPIFFLYFLYGKTWKDIRRLLLWCVPVFLLFIPLFFEAKALAPLLQDLVNQIAAGNTSAELSADGILYLLFASLNITAILSLSVGLLWFKLKKNDQWFEFRRWSFGMLVTYLILIPFLMSFNVLRTLKVAFEPLLRSDNVNNGGANFWGLINANGSASQPLVSISNFHLSISIVSVFLTLISTIILLNALFNWKLKKIVKFKLADIFTNKIDIQEFIIITGLFTMIYYAFFTKMHSRYLHTSVILLFIFLIIVFAKFGKRLITKTFIALFVIINIGYSLCNMSVFAWPNGNFENTYAIGISNPIWVRHFLDFFTTESFRISSILVFFSSMAIIWVYLKYMRKIRNKAN